MLHTLRRHLTFANVASGLALFIALGTGGAYAANTIGSDDVINESLLSEDIQNQQVGTSDLAIGSVWGSRIRDDAIQTQHVVNNSLKGHDIDEQTFTAPLVRAFVRVRPSTCTGAVGNETCDIERSKGVTSVKRLATGFYCVTAPALDSEKVSASVSVDFIGTGFPEANAGAMVLHTTSCPSTSNFGVITDQQPNVSVNSGTGTNNVQVAGTPGPGSHSNNVAFQLVIP